MNYPKSKQLGAARLVGLLVACALSVFLSRSFPAGAAPANPGDFQPVDLSKHFTDGSSNALPALAKGQQHLDGIPFIIGGRIELTGMHTARNGEFLPTQVTGIHVGRKADRLHLLLGARHGQKDGLPLASVILRYRNGEKRSLRLAYGLHARNSFGELDASSAELFDPNANIAWEYPASTTNGAVRLYRAEFANPLPEGEIASLDLASLFSPATPILFAVTLQTGSNIAPLESLPKRKVIQRAFQFPDSAYRREVTFRVLDRTTGKPVSKATALVSLKDDVQTYFFGQYEMDGSGLLQFAYPPQQAVALLARVTSPGLVPASVSVPLTNANDPAVVSLERGVTIGGTVTDLAGRPISGATVLSFMVHPSGTNLYTRTDLDRAQTSADGKWSATALAQSITNLHFEMIHPDYHTAILDPASAADLSSGQFAATLRPHIRIAGRVLDPSGKPLPGATVILDRGTNSPQVQADSAGRYTFVVREVTNSSSAVIALAPNLAPSYQAVRLVADAPPVELTLEPGSRFSMQLTDQNDQPVPEVKVSLSSWVGSKALPWRAETDRNGRFVWEHAPKGSVVFRFEKPGHYSHTHSTSLPNSGETTMTYGRRVVIAGKVVDAETQKPIEQFRARIRYKYQNGSGSSSTTGRRGLFTYNLGSSKYQEATVVVEARGYQPVSVTLPVNENGSFSNFFTLKKAIPVPGFILTGDGKPAPGAEVVLIDKNSYAYMYEAGRFRKGYSDYDVAVTDANGRFELTPKLEPDIIMAAHRTLGFGQAYASNIFAGEKLKLQPWSHVKGTVKVGEKVEPHYYISINNPSSYSSSPGEMRTALYSYIKFQPEPDGRFSFDFVPPGNRMVCLRYDFGENDYGGSRLTHGVPILAKPGQTNEVVIGGAGRTVTGKAELTGPDASKVDWRLYNQTLRSVQKPHAAIRPRVPRPGATAGERQRIMEEYQEALRKSMGERPDNIDYSLIFEEDGTFRVPNLPPGDYNLTLRAVTKSGSSSYNHVGYLNQRVTVPEGTTPFDLGRFVVKSNR